MRKNHNYRAAVCTLGCRVNQYEGDCVISEFTNLGFEIKEFEDICDVYVINTCTVTSGSDKKSKQMIRRAKRLNPNAIIAVCGCFSQINPGIFKSELYADIICGTREKTKIPQLALEILTIPNSKSEIINSVRDIREYKSYENISSYRPEKTRAYVKIQDGCENKCSYCIIPRARGSVKSRKYDDIYEEIKRFSDMGKYEIVLTGIEISAYENSLIGLLEKLNAESGLKNIKSLRLSSLDPSVINEEFTERIAVLDKIANHFHLSLQSGSAKILKAMRRKYDAETVIKNIFYAKEKIKDLTLTADIIVGFPGETDRDFEKTAETIKLLNIYHAHVFTYSKRAGTEAEKFEDQIGENIKNQRSKKIFEICGSVKEKIHMENYGKEFEVIIEEADHMGFYTAKTKNFLDVKVKIKNGARLTGTIQKIKITDQNKNCIIGEIL